MKYLLTLALILLSLGCFAAVYMQTDPNGNVIYSDTPENHGKPITIPTDNNNISVPHNVSPSASSPGLPASTSAGSEGGTTPPSAAHKAYDSFNITSPTPQQTFQNQRDIPVTIQIEPALQEGDKVQLYVDGVPAGEPSADLQQLAIHQIDRGEHTLTAALLDSEAHVLKKTDNITVFIHYSALPTGSGGIAPSPSGGVAPSSPGSGIVPAGSGITPGGSGVTPSGSGTVPASGSGITPPAQSGSGIVPGRP